MKKNSHNLVVYSEQGKKRVKPLFVAGVYVKSSEDGNVWVLNAQNEVVRVMDKIGKVSFDEAGIWISGQEQNPKKASFPWFSQSWLLTRFTEKELEKENFYR